MTTVIFKHLGDINFYGEFCLKVTWFKVGFPTGRDSETFRDSGTGKIFLSRDKGTTGQAQNLAKGRAGPAKFGTGRARIAKNWDGTRDKTGQVRSSSV